MIYSFPILILLIVNLIRSTPTEQNSLCLLFDGCKCTNNPDKNSVDIICDSSRLKSRNRAHFPTRRYDLSAFMPQNSNNINVFLLNNCNFETIPDGAFADLNIENLILANNGLVRMTSNAFRDIKTLKRLILKEKSLTEIERDAFKWIKYDLNELELSNLNIRNEYELDRFLMNENLVELRSLNVLKLKNMRLKELKQQWIPLVRDLNYLSLASNEIQHLEPGIFKSMPKLISLDLTDNLISNLSNLLDSLKPIKTNLKELKIGTNLIKNLNEFQELANLELLDLSNNKIEVLRSFTFHRLKSLTFLNLDSNRIKRISADFFSNSSANLVTLSLKGNYISNVPSIINFPRLKVLDLAEQNGRLNHLPDFAFERHSALNMNALSVNLESNDLFEFGFKSFCSRNGSQSEIQNIIMSYASMKNMNLCVLKQLNSSMISRVSLKVQPSLKELLGTDYTDVCNCDLKMFAARHNIELTGACLLVDSPCRIPSVNFNKYACQDYQFDC
jgi:Leucine-rich repeat (LRR) protein